MKRLFLLFIFSFSMGQKIIIPMDQAQNDHLKAYGIAYFTLAKNTNIEWLLNYRGGSFLLDAHQFVQTECRIRGVTFEQVNAAGLVNIYSAIEQGNMDIVLLEKKPKIAIYSPPNKQPWDDAVTLALTYAEVDYETLWDEEVHLGQLEKYDWLHLHHEDFTGQYGKFYRSHHNAQWYRDQKQQYEAVAAKLGYPSVHEQKKAIARIIKSYVGNGGFLFAMCSATDSYDIALSMGNVDGVHVRQNIRGVSVGQLPACCSRRPRLVLPGRALRLSSSSLRFPVMRRWQSSSSALRCSRYWPAMLCRSSIL